MAFIDQALINGVRGKGKSGAAATDLFVSDRHYIILLSLVICGIAYWGLQGDILGMYHDDGIYAVTAKSLSNRSGYRIISLPGSPPQTKYPILYSYILSLAWRISPVFPQNIIFLKLINIVFLFFIVIVAYRFYCACMAEHEVDGYLYAVLVGVNPGIFSFADFAVSDLLFVLIVLLTYWLYGTCESLWFRGWKSMALALLSAVALLTRSAGFPLVIAAAVHFVWTRRWRELRIYAITLVVAVLPWLLWRISNAVPVSDSSLLAYYLRYDLRNTAVALMWFEPGKSIGMVWANLRYFYDSLDIIWLLAVFPQLRLKIFVLGLLGAGVYCTICKQSMFLIAFFVTYLLLVLSWPFNPIRYAMPLVPLLLLFVFRGIHAIEAWLQPRGRWGAIGPIGFGLRLPVFVVVCLNIAWLISTVQPSNNRWVRGAYGQRLNVSWDGFLETFQWIRSHTEMKDLLATTYDPMYYLYTGRKAIIPAYHKPETYFYPYQGANPDVGSVEDIKRQFRVLGVRYLVTNPLNQFREADAVKNLLATLIASYSTRPELVFTSRDGNHKIYKIPVSG